ncbi:MAG: ATP-binding protein [Micrococcales bacterium]|nr:ATP-binding protein [Micrococcales bacterium]
MERDAYSRLLTWKSSPRRKPLIISGARQVGKTWLMQEFGRREYDDVVSLSFFDDDRLTRVLFPDRQASSIVDRIEVYLERRIDPDRTLLVFDEIQEAPDALASLKSFAESAPQYQIVAAGSLLGVALHSGHSFPVGKVDFLDLYPLSFSEFLRAVGRSRLDEVLTHAEPTRADVFTDELIGLLRAYHVVGGMPEAVASYADRRDLVEVQDVQRQILRAYDLDFSKHAPVELVPRLRKTLTSIPQQLGQEKKKFVYGQVEPGARARSYQSVIEWLVHAGLVLQVPRVTAPRVPLTTYAEASAFKLYLLDVGLLSALSGLAPATVLDGNQLFTEFKGALAEQYVLQELVASVGVDPCYWTNDRATAEVDFLADLDNVIVPIEVKSGGSLQAKSLKSYVDRFDPQVAVRTSLAGQRTDGRITNVPLYAIGRLREIVTAQVRNQNLLAER